MEARGAVQNTKELKENTLQKGAKENGEFGTMVGARREKAVLRKAYSLLKNINSRGAKQTERKERAEGPLHQLS